MTHRPPDRPSKRAVAAGLALLSPSPERLQHDRITRDTVQIADAAGGIGQPYRVEGLLGRLERHGDIGPAERLAGEKFSELFRAAHLEPLHAADMARRSHTEPAGEPNGVSAREGVNRALDALGGLHSACGTCAWMVLGCEMSLAAWARREGWGGRPINGHVAKGTLLGALGVLSRHFGF